MEGSVVAFITSSPLIVRSLNNGIMIPNLDTRGIIVIAIVIKGNAEENQEVPKELFDLGQFWKSRNR